MEPTISVCPSGWARARRRAATSPLAPVRFSATTGCPTACCIRVAIARATMSDGAPARRWRRRIGRSSVLVAPDDAEAARRRLVTLALVALPPLRRLAGGVPRVAQFREARRQGAEDGRAGRLVLLPMLLVLS